MKTDLCKLLTLYGSDKALTARQDRTCHSYSEYYHSLFKDRRQEVLNVLEVGIGRSEQHEPGPSLRAWRDYFPKSHIYGADINKKLMLRGSRLQTVLCNHTIPSGFKEIKRLPIMDIIIEDGLHTLKGSVVALVMLWGRLNHKGIYIIEDIKPEDVQPLFALAKQYGQAELKQFGNKYDDTVITIRKQ